MDRNKRHAYIPVAKGEGFTLGIVEEDSPGYYPTDNYPTVPTHEEAWRWADSCNAGLGVSHRDAVEIQLTTMRKRGRVAS